MPNPAPALALSTSQKAELDLETQLPADQEVHLIMDNYCTHRSAEVQCWLKPKKRQRFHFHFTPTSSSWLKQVEGSFALITGRLIRRGTFRSADELEAAIYKMAGSLEWPGNPVYLESLSGRYSRQSQAL